MIRKTLAAIALTAAALTGSGTASATHRYAEVEKRVPVSTLVMGDSLHYFSADELHSLAPAWTIDGIRGSELPSFFSRYAAYAAVNGAPDRFTTDLGTNEEGATLQMYRDALAELPASTVVVLTLPWRDPAFFPDRVEAMQQIAQWMRKVASERPATCVNNWRLFISNHPALLVDGVHGTPLGEQRFAEHVADAMTECWAEWKP